MHIGHIPKLRLCSGSCVFFGCSRPRVPANELGTGKFHLWERETCDLSVDTSPSLLFKVVTF
jgi:hypothetical protein